MVDLTIKIKNFPKLHVAYITHIGRYEDCYGAWERLLSWAKNSNINIDNIISVGVCYDNPEVVQDCRYDACIQVEKGVITIDYIKIKVLESRKCISTIHKGSYDIMINTYKKIYTDKINERYGVDLLAPCFEIYKNNPHNTPPNELLTEIFVPLREQNNI